MIQRPVYRRFDRRFLASAAVAALALVGCAEGNSSGTSSAAELTSSSASVVEAATSDLVADTAMADATVKEQTFADAWGPSTGSQAPQLAANDHTGQPQTLDSLSGDKGLLLVFSRSADW